VLFFWLPRGEATVSSVKTYLPELVDRVEGQHDRVVVTRNGRPAAVLISSEDQEEPEETLAIMSDPALVAQVRESERALAKGERGTGLDELRRAVDRRGTLPRERGPVGGAGDGSRMPSARTPPADCLSSGPRDAGRDRLQPAPSGQVAALEWEGCHSARRGPYRIVYRIDEATHAVAVLAVGHRADIYRRR
jgi:antitoxin YefM